MSKTAVAVAALVVVVLAVVIGIWRLGPSATARRAAAEAAQQKTTVIDVATLQPQTITSAEWTSFKPDAQFINYRVGPDDKRYATIHKCESCGADIPEYGQPPVPKSQPMKAEMHMAAYKCPKCGKRAYILGP